ncbi:hypothetical protein JCM10213_000417 [Rhodosporidiobolus nylandii]
MHFPPAFLTFICLLPLAATRSNRDSRHNQRRQFDHIPTSLPALPTGLAREAKSTKPGGLSDLLVKRKDCATGVHIIVARGSGESAGKGIIGQVATLVKKQVSGSDSMAIDYPASLQDYQSSSSKGVSAMTSAIQSYLQQCPDSKIVLMGYSQGAQVVGDTLCGSSQTSTSSFGASGGSTSGSGYSLPAGGWSLNNLGGSKARRAKHNDGINKRNLAEHVKDNIVAVIQMGDPTFVAGKSWDVGSATRNGVSPRSGSCFDNLADKTQSYCDQGDTFCASGSSMDTHLSYVRTYGQKAADFVAAKVK